MAFQDSAGNKFTNHSAMKSSEARIKAKSPAREAISHEEEHGEPDAANDGKALAQQHGPAVQIDIQHDHEGGRHVVHAMHANGHSHETEHGSMDEAHKFAHEVAGGGAHESEEGEGY